MSSKKEPRSGSPRAAETRTGKASAGRRARPAVACSGTYNVFVEAALSTANLTGCDSPFCLPLMAEGEDHLDAGFLPPPILRAAANAFRLAFTSLQRDDREALEEAYSAVKDPLYLRRRLARLLLRRVRDVRVPMQQREAGVAALAALSCACDDTGAEELSDLDLDSLRAEGFDSDLLTMAEAACSDEDHPVYAAPYKDKDGFARLLESSLERTRRRDATEVSLGAADAILDLKAKVLFVRGVAKPITLDGSRGRIDDLRILMEKRQGEPESGWVAVLDRKTRSRPSISRAGLWKTKKWLDALIEGGNLSTRLVSAQQNKRVRFNVSAIVRGG